MRRQPQPITKSYAIIYTDVIRLGNGVNGNGNVSRGSIPCHPTMKELIQMWFIRFGFVVAAMAVGYWLGTWSKVRKGKKPFMWWVHKVLCEFAYLIRSYVGWKMYYRLLNKLCKYGFNLYGEPLKKIK